MIYRQLCSDWTICDRSPISAVATYWAMEVTDNTAVAHRPTRIKLGACQRRARTKIDLFRSSTCTPPGRPGFHLPALSSPLDMILRQQLPTTHEPVDHRPLPAEQLLTACWPAAISPTPPGPASTTTNPLDQPPGSTCSWQGYSDARAKATRPESRGHRQPARRHGGERMHYRGTRSWGCATPMRSMPGRYS